jgi:hypothetical protein
MKKAPSTNHCPLFLVERQAMVLRALAKEISKRLSQVEIGSQTRLGSTAVRDLSF